MNIVYFGNGIRGIKCLEAVLKNGWNICAVVGHEETSELLGVAKKNQIKMYWPSQVNDPDFLSDLQAHDPDLFILSGYNKILHKKILGIPKKGAVNLHGGKLPEYRGVAPINWQIISGEKMGGCCVLFVDEGIDTGDIIEQQYYKISDNSTAQDIIDKQIELFPKMLLNAIENIHNNTINAVQQDKKAGAYFTRRYPRDGKVDWKTMTADKIHNIVRALNGPYPHAFCFYEGEKIEITKTQLLSETIKGIPGRISLQRKGNLIVHARDRALMITEVFDSRSRERVSPSTLLSTGMDFE